MNNESILEKYGENLTLVKYITTSTFFLTFGECETIITHLFSLCAKSDNILIISCSFSLSKLPVGSSTS